MYKIYFVDDAAWLVAELVSLIDYAAEGFTVAGWATNPFIAAEEIERICPTLVLCDVRMDGMDGLELAGRVRERVKGVSFCFLSAYDRFDYAVTAMKLGAVDYLTKPIDEGELRAVLAKVRHARRESAAAMLLDAALLGPLGGEDESRLSAVLAETGLSEGRPRVAVFYGRPEGGPAADQAPDLFGCAADLSGAAGRAEPIYEGGDMVIALLRGAKEEEIRLIAARRGVGAGLSAECDSCRQLVAAVRAARLLGGGGGAEGCGLTVFSPGGADYGVSVVGRMLEALAKNLTGRPSLASFAARYGYNPSYLSNLFKRTTGKNFVDYVMDLRLEKAKADIARTNLSMREIALGVGYEDYFHFSKLFKKHTGLSPTEFRARVRTQDGPSLSERGIGPEEARKDPT